MLNLNDRFQQHCGTERYHHIFGKVLCTDGVHDVRETLKCYWLIWDVAVVLAIKLRLQEFVTITATTQDSHVVVSYVSELHERDVELHQQEYFTDLPENSTLKLFAINDGEHFVILLPSEY